MTGVAPCRNCGYHVLPACIQILNLLLDVLSSSGFRRHLNGRQSPPSRHHFRPPSSRPPTIMPAGAVPLPECTVRANYSSTYRDPLEKGFSAEYLLAPISHCS